MNLETLREQYNQGGYAECATYQLHGEFNIEFPSADQREEFLATINVLMKTERHHRSQFFDILAGSNEFSFYESEGRWGMQWLWNTDAQEADDAYSRFMWLTGA